MKHISIIQLGFLKRQINLKKLKLWKSSLFTVDSINEISSMPELENRSDWQYLADSTIKSNLQHASNSHVTIAITEYQLEDNFYMRRVNNVVVISLFEVGDLLENYHIPIENFIIKNIYEIVTFLHIYKVLPDTQTEIPEIIHDETRNCLFDMHGRKRDIIHFFISGPSLCPQCKAYLQQKQLPKDFMKNLIHEIRIIRKPIFYKMYDFVKCHPGWTIVIIIVTQICIGLLSGLTANFLYNWILG
jgi:hypothetical protein